MKKLIIVGGGPRGLFALENLYKELANSDLEVKTTLFEERKLFGCSHVYDTIQPDTNWINISEKLLDLSKRPEICLKQVTVPAFLSYFEWRDIDPENTDDSEPDRYPPRNLVGQYLIERFDTIAQALFDAELLSCINERVTDITLTNNTFRIETKQGSKHFADEVLMTIGHQQTTRDGQIIKWIDHTKQNAQIHFFESPYPTNELLKDKAIFKNSSVALRGFGLAMIDVIRALTIGLGGKFELINDTSREMEYVPSDHTPRRFIPFSLDGLPQCPKPLNEAIDSLFKPKDWEFKFIDRVLVFALRQSYSIENLDFMIEPISYVIANVFKRLETSSNMLDDHGLQSLIKVWIYDDNTEHELIVSKKQNPAESLNQFLMMACGLTNISLDYCIGQVWRHLQPTLYELLAYPQFDSEIVNDIVNIDERIKRYSYGPPVDSLQQLLALMRAGIVKTQIIDDPDIKMVANGWLFEPQDDEVLADIMINTVLDSPSLKSVNTPVIKKLLDKGLITPIHENLGVQIEKDGRVITQSGKVIPLAFVGRLCKGSLLGVDAILECFGSPLKYWAKGFVKRNIEK